jgi:hypothetical protein
MQHYLQATDEVMDDYVTFICNHIPAKCSAFLRGPGGWANVEAPVPADVELLHRDGRMATYKITILGHDEQLRFPMSRRWSPEKVLCLFQERLTEIAHRIIKENGMDKYEVWAEYQPLRNLKLPLQPPRKGETYS